MNKELGLNYCEQLLKEFKTDARITSKTEVYAAITALYWADVITTNEREEFLTRLGWGM